MQRKDKETSHNENTQQKKTTEEIVLDVVLDTVSDFLYKSTRSALAQTSSTLYAQMSHSYLYWRGKFIGLGIEPNFIDKLNKLKIITDYKKLYYNCANYFDYLGMIYSYDSRGFDQAFKSIYKNKYKFIGLSGNSEIVSDFLNLIDEAGNLSSSSEQKQEAVSKFLDFACSRSLCDDNLNFFISYVAFSGDIPSIEKILKWIDKKFPALDPKIYSISSQFLISNFLRMAVSGGHSQAIKMIGEYIVQSGIKIDRHYFDSIIGTVGNFVQTASRIGNVSVMEAAVDVAKKIKLSELVSDDFSQVFIGNAALSGNTQAFYEAIKLNSELGLVLDKNGYNQVIYCAVQSGSVSMIKLALEQFNLQLHSKNVVASRLVEKAIKSGNDNAMLFIRRYIDENHLMSEAEFKNKVKSFNSKLNKIKDKSNYYGAERMLKALEMPIENIPPLNQFDETNLTQATEDQSHQKLRK